MGAYRHIVAVACALLWVISGFAQTPWTVQLNGKVLEDDKPLNRAILILKNNGEEVQKVITAPNGKFSMTLKSDNDYELYFTKKGYVTKFISYNTQNVPEDKIEGIYSEFIFQLELFKKMEGLNTSVLDFPVFKVKYYPGVKNLEYDKKHENKVRARLNVLLKEYETAKKKEAEDKLNAVAAGEKAETDKAYNAQLEVASGLFTAKKYKEAQDAYEKALEIKPKADFPKDRIVAIEKLIKEDVGAKKLSKELQARYDVLIKLADAAFAKEKYVSANTNYMRASQLAPHIAYPKDQMAMAQEEIQNAKGDDPFKSATDEKYKLILSRADNEFMGEDYVRSRASYLSALKVKPDMAYAKDRIAEIDSIVKASRTPAVVATEPVKSKSRQKDKKPSKGGAAPEENKEVDEGTYLLALAEEYDEGITEEIEVAGGKKITRIIVVKDGKANEYKKEVYSWATYYKKNNKTIPRYIFENETKK